MSASRKIGYFALVGLGLFALSSLVRPSAKVVEVPRSVDPSKSVVAHQFASKGAQSSVTVAREPPVPTFNPNASGTPIRVVNRRAPDEHYQRWFDDGGPRLAEGPRPASLAEVNTPLPEGLDSKAVDAMLRSMKTLRDCFAESSLPRTGKAMVLLQYVCGGKTCPFDRAIMDASTMQPETDSVVLACAEKAFAKTVERGGPGEKVIITPTLVNADVDQDEIYRLFVPERK
jgi:hypothetical protein